MAKLIAKELTVLFWGFIYGEVFGYIVAPLSNATFSPLTSGIIAMIGAFIIITPSTLSFKILIKRKRTHNT